MSVPRGRLKPLIQSSFKLHGFQVCMYFRSKRLTTRAEFINPETLVLDRRSIDLNGAQEKEGHFQYKNFLRASK